MINKLVKDLFLGLAFRVIEERKGLSKKMLGEFYATKNIECVLFEKQDFFLILTIMETTVL